MRAAWMRRTRCVQYLRPVEGLTPAVLFNDERERLLDPLVGGESLFTRAALTAAADKAAVFRYSCFYNLGF